MKRFFVLLMVAMMSTVMLNAKTVRGMVADESGKPVAGVKMMIVNTETPSVNCMTETDADGSFVISVPDDIDTCDLVDVFARQGTNVVRYWNTPSGLRIVIKAPEAEQR